jgi:RNA polymerase sigma-70 factor (ECF subfamily)
MIAAEIDRTDPDGPRSRAVRDCVQKLSRPHRQILLLRYSRDTEIGEIAEKVGRSEGAVYRLLSRLRASLHRCITESIAS